MDQKELENAVAFIKCSLTSARDLAERVFAYLGLAVFQECARALQNSCPVFASKPFVSIDVGLLVEDLEQCRNFSFGRNGMGVLALRDMESNEYWNFSRNGKPEIQKDLVLCLAVRGVVDGSGGGVRITPRVTGPYASLDAAAPQFRIFEAVNAFNPSVNPIVGKIVEGQGSFIVGWSQVQLGAICSVYDVFKAFIGKRHDVRHLAYQKISPFDPAPSSRDGNFEMLFIPAEHRQLLLDIWSIQLSNFGQKSIIWDK